jgi:hypothetical protein
VYVGIHACVDQCFNKLSDRTNESGPGQTPTEYRFAAQCGGGDTVFGDDSQQREPENRGGLRRVDWTLANENETCDAYTGAIGRLSPTEPSNPSRSPRIDFFR